MSKIFDMTGKRYGRLVVTGMAGMHKTQRAMMWHATCDCGNEVCLPGVYMRRGDTKSCGCLHKDMLTATKTTHGLSKTRAHMRWCGMKQRCSNKNNTGYASYGGRGITVCKRWLDSFEDYLADVGPRPSRKHSMDRIDVNGNYEPSNVRWATASEQEANKRPREEWANA